MPNLDQILASGRQYDDYLTPLPLGALPGGVLPMSDWKQALIMRGFGWQFSVGSFATQTDTPLTGGGAGTVMDFDQPEFCISVPAGWIMVPLKILIAARPGLQTTDSHVNDILLMLDRAAKWAGDGTVTAVSPINMRTDISGGCPLVAFQAATADITDPTDSIELARVTKLTDVQGTAATVNLQELSLNYEPANPPMIVGPAGLYGYFGGSIAVVGFAHASFLALPASLFTSLK